MAFAVRTNVGFNGTTEGGDCPAPGHCVSFDVKNFLHIKEVSYLILQGSGLKAFVTISRKSNTGIQVNHMRKSVVKKTIRPLIYRYE